MFCERFLSSSTWKPTQRTLSCFKFGPREVSLAVICILSSFFPCRLGEFKHFILWYCREWEIFCVCLEAFKVVNNFCTSKLNAFNFNISELQIPEKGNVFYAINNTVSEIKLVVRKRSDIERIKSKQKRKKEKLTL